MRSSCSEASRCRGERSAMSRPIAKKQQLRAKRRESPGGISTLINNLGVQTAARLGGALSCFTDWSKTGLASWQEAPPITCVCGGQTDLDYCGRGVNPTTWRVGERASERERDAPISSFYRLRPPVHRFHSGARRSSGGTSEVRMPWRSSKRFRQRQQLQRQDGSRLVPGLCSGPPCSAVVFQLVGLSHRTKKLTDQV